jgi:hypothetical protein
MDLWLGLWGRYLPIALIYILLIIAFSANRIPLYTRSEFSGENDTSSFEKL